MVLGVRPGNLDLNLLPRCSPLKNRCHMLSPVTVPVAVGYAGGTPSQHGLWESEKVPRGGTVLKVRAKEEMELSRKNEGERVRRNIRRRNPRE